MGNKNQSLYHFKNCTRKVCLRPNQQWAPSVNCIIKVHKSLSSLSRTSGHFIIKMIRNIWLYRYLFFWMAILKGINAKQYKWMNFLKNSHMQSFPNCTYNLFSIISAGLSTYISIYLIKMLAFLGLPSSTTMGAQGIQIKFSY